MEYHLERGLRLHTEPEHKSLYSWAINEIDAQDRPVGGDQIPWPWTLYFTATSCVLAVSTEIKARSRRGSSPLVVPEVEQREVIRVQLRPGSPRDDEDYFRQPKFKMFGTDRTINKFQLDIYQLQEPTEHEHCEASGVVSYTAETDFREETADDWIGFSLFVKPETFARYRAEISDGLVDEIHFAVGSVDGFYSDWSPSISTSKVKVLTSLRSEQQVDLPPGLGFEPPRLGFVGETHLYINRRLHFVHPERDEAAEPIQAGSALAHPEPPRLPTPADPQTLKLLKSLKRAAWAAVVLLTLIFFASLQS